MLFCPKCKSIMMPKTSNGKRVLACSCGYKSQGDVKISESVKKDDRKIETLEKQIEIHPKVDADCSKCGNKEAYAWDRQTRSSDEPPTKFFKCTKCGHTWRDYK